MQTIALVTAAVGLLTAIINSVILWLHCQRDKKEFKKIKDWT